MSQATTIPSLTVSTYVYPGAKAFAARVANKGNQFLQLPDNVLFNIFGRLSCNDLAQASDTSRKLHNVVSDKKFQETYWENYSIEQVKREFPAVQVIDEAVWRRVFSPETLTLLGLSFDDADPLDKKALRAFLKRLDFTKIEGIGANTGVTILTLPKGLTFNKLIALAWTPKEGGRAAVLRSVWHHITQEFGDIAVAKTTRIAISNNVLKESRGKTYQVRRQMAIDIGGQMPEFLPTVTLCILTYMSAPTPIYLFNTDPWTYAGCVEMIDNIPVAVGGFAPDGLFVTFSSFDYCSLGVGFVQKLQTIGSSSLGG